MGADGWCLHTHSSMRRVPAGFKRCRALCLLLGLVPLPLQAHREAALGRVWLTACWLQRCRASACCVSWRSCFCSQRGAGVAEGSCLTQTKTLARRGREAHNAAGKAA